MKPKPSFYLLTVALAALVLGCSSVVTDQPLSAKPEPIDKERLEGVWLSPEEDAAPIHLMFASNGVAKLIWVGWESNRFITGHGEVIVTEGQEHNFMSLRISEKGEVLTNHYSFVQYSFTENDDLIVWLPEIDVFQKEVQAGRLKGTVQTGKYSKSITITNSAAALLKIINDPKDSRFFNYKEPMVLRRIGDVE